MTPTWRTVYLGAPEPSWIGRTEVPLFVSYGRLRRLKHKLPRSPRKGRWALDSRGFRELADHGRWTITPQRYVADVHRYDEEIGNLEWAAPQDRMCEESVIMGGRWGRETFAGTRRPGETMHQAIYRHLDETVENYALLAQLWSETGSRADCPFFPVLQGQRVEDYHRCWDLYEAAGVDLSELEMVGVGSVCRRQGTHEIGELMTSLQERDQRNRAGREDAGILPIHAFGCKTQGLQRYGGLIGSSDSMAWSDHARHNDLKHPACTAGHARCTYCLVYAEAWHGDLLAKTG